MGRRNIRGNNNMKINVHNAQYGTSNFHICFNSSAAQFLILLILFFFQYAAKALTPDDVIKAAEISSDHRKGIQEIFQAFQASIRNSLNKQQFQNLEPGREQWQDFGKQIIHYLAPGVEKNYKDSQYFAPEAQATGALFMLKIDPENQKMQTLLFNPNFLKIRYKNQLNDVIDNHYKVFYTNGGTDPRSFNQDQYKNRFFAQMVSGFIFSEADTRINSILQQETKKNYFLAKINNKVPQIKSNSEIRANKTTEGAVTQLDIRSAASEYDIMFKTLKDISPSANDKAINTAIEKYFSTAESFLANWASLESIGPTSLRDGKFNDSNPLPHLTRDELIALAHRHLKILTKDVINRILCRRDLSAEF